MKENSLHGERQSEKYYFKWIKNLNIKVKIIKQIEENVGEYLGDRGAKNYIYKHKYMHVYIHIYICMYIESWRILNFEKI